MDREEYELIVKQIQTLTSNFKGDGPVRFVVVFSYGLPTNEFICGTNFASDEIAAEFARHAFTAPGESYTKAFPTEH